MKRNTSEHFSVYCGGKKLVNFPLQYKVFCQWWTSLSYKNPKVEVTLKAESVLPGLWFLGRIVSLINHGHRWLFWHWFRQENFVVRFIKNVFQRKRKICLRKTLHVIHNTWPFLLYRISQWDSCNVSLSQSQIRVQKVKRKKKINKSEVNISFAWHPKDVPPTFTLIVESSRAILSSQAFTSKHTVRRYNVPRDQGAINTTRRHDNNTHRQDIDRSTMRMSGVRTHQTWVLYLYSIS